MVERRDGCLPTAAVGFAPADDAAVGRDAHHKRIDRGARAPRKQRRRRPMIHGNAKRESLDPFDGDRRHVASTRSQSRDAAMTEAATAAGPCRSKFFLRLEILKPA